MMRGAKIHGQSAEFSVTPEQVGEVLGMVEKGEISGKQSKELFGLLEGTSRNARELANERGMRVVTDASTVEPLCRQIVEQSPQQAAQYRAGKKGVFGYFVGQVMKASKGSADPKLVNEVLTKILESE